MMKKQYEGGIYSGSEALLSNFSLKSRYAEAYRTLRTNVYFAAMDNELNSLVVTSSVKGEGKSTTVANLAYTIAQTGKSVLMVDADLRRPGLSTRYGQAKNVGLSNLVVDVLGKRINGGKVADYGLNDLIKLNGLQQRSCVLEISEAGNQVDLYFLKGDLVDVYWRNRPADKKLANVLVAENLLTAADAELALGHQKRSPRRLGAILLSLRLMEAKDLYRMLSLQVLEAFRVAAEMTAATFTVRSAGHDEIAPADPEAAGFNNLTKELLTDQGSSYLRDTIAAHIVETDQDNLFLLPCGSLPPDPAELIGSARTSYLIKYLKTRYDVVIFDSVPIIPASDALLLAPQVDGVILVVLVGKTSRRLVRDAAHQLKNAHGKVLGVLLNKAEMNTGSYYQYY
jgi:Mrp family chromosome partitioning ATPase